MISPDCSEPVCIWKMPDDYKLSPGSDLLIEESNESNYYMIPIQYSNKENLLNHLEAFSKLEEGWDGSEGIVPYVESISNCSKFLSRIPLDFIEKIKLEDLYPTNHGTVVVDLLNSKDEKVSIEFGITKIGFFTDFNDGFNYRLDSVRFNYNSLPSDLISAVTKLYQSYIF